MTNFLSHVHARRLFKDTVRIRATWGLGGITAFLFMHLTVTGILLMFFYTPTSGHAYGCMLEIVSIVPFGWFLRNLHRWAGEAMIVTALLHMGRVVATGSYYGHRRLNWLVGLSLLVLTILLGFTGYLLPWDQVAYWGIAVTTRLFDYVPIFGRHMKEFFLGGPDVGSTALLRFYVLHCVVLPCAFAGLAAYHFWRVRLDGGLAHPPVSQRKKVATRGDLMLIEAGTVVMVTLILTVAAVFWEAPLAAEANPGLTPSPAKAAWYLIWIQELLHLFPPRIGGILLPAMAGAALALVPFFDCRNNLEGCWFPRKRIFWWGGTFLLMSTLLALTVIALWFRGPGWSWTMPW